MAVVRRYSSCSIGIVLEPTITPTSEICIYTHLNQYDHVGLVPHKSSSKCLNIEGTDAKWIAKASSDEETKAMGPKHISNIE